MLNNPLGVVGIGSTFSQSGTFGSTVFDPAAAITTMGTPLVQVSKSMRGESSVVYGKQMNQFSVGFAGAYGVTGLSQCKAAVAAYGGLSTGFGSKSISIEYHVLMTGAVQTITFDALSPDAFVETLMASPKFLAVKALETYVAFTVALAGADLIAVLSDTAKANYAGVKKAYDSWIAASETFRKNFGEGIVVGVVWGGIGFTSLAIEDDSKAEAWKGGGAANFQYASVSTSISVDATYDASGSTDTSKIKIQCTSDAIGACVLNYTDQWSATLAGKGLDALTNIKPLDLPPLTTTKATLPTVPAFITPQKDAATTANAAKVTQDGVGSAAKAASYDALKKAYDKLKGPNDPDFAVTLADFIKNALAASDPKAALALKDSVGRNTLSTRRLIEAGKKKTHTTHHQLQGAGGARAPAAPAQGAAAGGDYAPVGVWVTDWASLLPWLAQGRDNRIEDTSDAETSLQFRMIQQDFFALSKLYRYAATLGLQFDFSSAYSPVHQPLPFGASDCQDIADDFANQCSALAKVDPAKQSYADAARAAYDSLGDSARIIYDKWNEIGFLRSCELGMGVLIDGQASVQTTQPGPFGRSELPLTRCTFSPSALNYSAFAKFQKVLPLIVPETGDIIAIYAQGALAGAAILTEQVEFADPVAFWTPDPNSLWMMNSDTTAKSSSTVNGDTVETIVKWAYMSFKANAGYLEFSPSYPLDYTYLARSVQLFPIPFSAADGVAWEGQSFSTNVGADEDLRAKLQTMADQMQTARQWDFTGDDLDSSWSAEQPYSRSGVRKQYFGLVDEPPGAF